MQYEKKQKIPRSENLYMHYDNNMPGTLYSILLGLTAGWYASPNTARKLVR